MTAAQEAPANLVLAVRRWLGIQRSGGTMRVPPERELAELFCVSRSEIRKVLAILASEGQLTRHVGRGTFIVGGDEGYDGAAEGVAAVTSPPAAMQARLAIEPELCRLAAVNATTNQIGEMRSLCRKMREAPNWEAYAELDWRLHGLIAAATGNVLLNEIQTLLNGVRRYVVWGGLTKKKVGPPVDYHSFGEHDRIVDAIEARDPETAGQAMVRHLETTRARMGFNATG